MTDPDVVVCSFFSQDEYYTQHAEHLRATLVALDIPHRLEAIEIGPDEDWADVCRRKIPFLASVCREYPNSRVLWVDVDCRLLSLPDVVRKSTADILGFQRGFGNPLRIGYSYRTRFWEPSLVGIGATTAAREFIFLAERLERESTLKATDDYFFEEAWRVLAPRLNFQVLSSRYVMRNASAALGREPQPFFMFVSSGNVGEFKEKVVQHQAPTGNSSSKSLKWAKKMHQSMPAGLGRRARRVSDVIGLTGALVSRNADSKAPVDDPALQGPHKLATTALKAAQRGDAETYHASIAELEAAPVSSVAIANAVTAAEAYAHYSVRGEPDVEPLRLSWWSKPFPGNYGDWLSPLLFEAYTDRSIRYRAPQRGGTGPHIFAVGSIGRFIKQSSIVVGTGVSAADTLLSPRADYVSVRGPLTAAILAESGGPTVESFGDPALALPRIIPGADRSTTNGRIAFIRHFTHLPLPVMVPDNVDELSVLMSRPGDIAAFIATLHQYDSVVTSAMHVFITCNAYGIPCALVDFQEFSSMVHGDGMKYRDYSLGAGLGIEVTPDHVPADLRSFDLDSVTRDLRITDEKIDEVEAAMREAIRRYGVVTGS